MSQHFMSFNTGRQYTKAGQKIYAVGRMVDDIHGIFWNVTILDISRGITAKFDKLISFTDTSIMRAYDASHYDIPSPFDGPYLDLIKHFHLEDTRHAL